MELTPTPQAYTLTAPENWQAQTDAIIATMPVAIQTPADLQSSQGAANLAQKQLKALAEARLSVTRNLDALKKDIMAKEEEIAQPLNTALASLKAMQDAYLEAERRKQLLAKIEQERKLKLIQTTESLLNATVADTVNRIKSWATTEEAETRLPVVEGYTPKAPANTDPTLWLELWAKAKPALVTAAQEKLTALRSGNIVETNTITVQATAAKVDAMVVEPAPVLKNVRTTLKPVVTGVLDLADLAAAFMATADDKAKAKVAELMLAGVKPGTPVRGVEWQEIQTVIQK